ncbi:MAG TPA: type II toxin-antitoxin system RelE/ParE family toxin [Candidatus Paceibacterota bacterium]|nr:type II toxin-antitoxin system RelE/ParE family toxin [Candidatus Paceibacterota bacterium]
MMIERHCGANIMVSEKALQEFKKIWREEFGEEISDQKALDEATALLALFDAIYRPIKKEWLDEYETKNQTNGAAEHHN